MFPPNDLSFVARAFLRTGVYARLAIIFADSSLA